MRDASAVKDAFGADQVLVVDEPRMSNRVAFAWRGALPTLDAEALTVTLASSALQELAKAGFDPLYGARPLKRAIQQNLENPMAKLILEGRFGPNDVIPVDFRDGRFNFERTVH